MTMAFDPDLDDFVVIALRQMVELVAQEAGIKKQEAYALCSLAADVRVTQVVNGSKGHPRHAGQAVFGATDLIVNPPHRPPWPQPHPCARRPARPHR